MTWKKHITTKRKEIDLKIKRMYWLLGRRSALSLENKLLLYKAVIKPIWIYGIELWGCSSKSKVNIIQRLQSKTLRLMTNAPWFVSNHTLHADLKISTVAEEVRKRAEIHNFRLQNHPNVLASELTQVENSTRRLKRILPHNLRE